MAGKDNGDKVIPGKIESKKGFIEWIRKIFLYVALVESEKLKNQLKLKGGLKSLYVKSGKINLRTKKTKWYNYPNKPVETSDSHNPF